MADFSAENKFIIGIGIADLQLLTQLETRLQNIQAKFGRQGTGMAPGARVPRQFKRPKPGEIQGTTNATTKATQAQHQYNQSLHRGTPTVNKYQQSLNRLYNTQMMMSKASRAGMGLTPGFAGAAMLSKNEFSDLIRRVTLWSGAVGLLFGTIYKMKEMITLTRSLESAMTEFQKVMAADTPFGKLRNNLFDISVNLGLAIDKVLEIGKIWGQQGKSMQEVSALTRTTVIGVNSALLESGQAVEFLTSITKAYNIEAERSISLIDKIMKVQANYEPEI
jgi:hypothetical protein